MKISVKTLKGTHFDVDANPEDTVADVKKSIEILQRQSAYPAEQQVLIHQGKILKDDTTLQDNNVSENSFLVIMLRKAKGSSSGASTASDKPTIQVSPANSETPTPAPAPTAAPAATVALRVPIPSATITSDSGATVPNEVDAYGQAASNHVTGSNLEQTIQNLLHMGGGTWDRATVVRALRSAYNNPERAVDLLNSGIREQEETPIVVPAAITEQRVGTPVEAPQTAQPAVPSSGPNAIPLNLFPQGIPSTGINIGVGRLDFLHNRSKFRALQALVQANPQVLQPMRKKLGKQIPRVMRLIRKHQAEFLRLINERAEGEERNLLSQLADAMPQALPVTPEEREAIEQGIPSTGINTGVGRLDFLRNSSQFRALQALVQANPQLLQPMLKELGKQNPHVMRLIQEHQAEFLRLINGPAEGEERNLQADAMPQALTVTHEEREAIERLEAMGFKRSLVLQVFFACNRNEELTTNYLLDHLHEFEDDQ